MPPSAAWQCPEKVCISAFWKFLREMDDTGRTPQRAEQVASAAGPAFIAVQAQALASEILRDLGDMQGALAAVDRALNTASCPDVGVRLRAEVLRSRGTL